MRSISCFTLFAILVSAVPAFSADVSHSLSSKGAVVISRMEGFGSKFQGGNSIELTMLLEWPTWAISGTLGIHGTGATNLDGGWGYRGYEGAHGRFQVEVPFIEGTSDSDTTVSDELPTGSGFRGGWGGGGGGFFSRYRETDLLFFYPSVYAFLFLDYYTGSPRIRVRYALPFEWYFRKDLATSFSIGISIGVVYTWTIPR